MVVVIVADKHKVNVRQLWVLQAQSWLHHPPACSQVIAILPQSDARAWKRFVQGPDEEDACQGK